MVLGVGQVHEPADVAAASIASSSGRELGHGVGVVDDDDLVRVVDERDAEVAAAREVEELVVGVDGANVGVGKVLAYQRLRASKASMREGCGRQGTSTVSIRQA